MTLDRSPLDSDEDYAKKVADFKALTAPRVPPGAIVTRVTTERTKPQATIRPRANNNGKGEPPPDEQPLDALAGLRNAGWLDTQEFPPLRYAIDGIIPQGLSLIVSAPKVGKSWFVGSASLAIASGGVALGRIRTGDPKPVLLLAFEDGDARLQDRWRKLMDGAPLPERLDYLTQLEEGVALIDTLRAWLDRHGDEEPTFFLDTLGKVMPPALRGEPTYNRDYRVMSTIKRVVDDYPGTKGSVVHHDRKAQSEDFVESVSGTYGLTGAADTILTIKRKRHETDAILNVTGRDVAEGEYALRFLNGYEWQLDGLDLAAASRRVQERRTTGALGDSSLEVLAYVNDHPNGVRPKEVSTALGIDQPNVYLKRLADSGRIVHAGRGLYTPRISVTSVTNTEPELPIET